MSGVILDGVKYSFLDPEAALPARVPDQLQPFLTPFREAEGVFYLSAEDVSAHIGAELVWDGRRCAVSYLGHELILSPGSPDALWDGEALTLKYPARLEGEELLFSKETVTLLGLYSDMYYPEMPATVQAPEHWLVIP